MASFTRNLFNYPLIDLILCQKCENLYYWCLIVIFCWLEKHFCNTIKGWAAHILPCSYKHGAHAHTIMTATERLAEKIELSNYFFMWYLTVDRSKKPVDRTFVASSSIQFWPTISLYVQCCGSWIFVPYLSAETRESLRGMVEFI